ncbi:glycoside hydrolase family 3 C-terminal domain-containing protein [Kutzneria kofuensis]|uniref:Beta-glucosidase n=1 Tax=Kutzneria kofuensis TaxID=103725 RepID=A0A7W9KR12_9PSEU|nr:glycoside hydrolase family 3 C-terminal domain-containing protein [Kutzneria kofuensis]MBB5896853.1 beta-glucosidase [Kutzneria kofuensis]
MPDVDLGPRSEVGPGPHDARPPREVVDEVATRLSRDDHVALALPVQPPIPELGLPAFRLALEDLPSALPGALGLGSTWNPGLARRIGAAVGVRVRALRQNPLRRVPAVVPLYDPWSERNGDGYSEDPLLTSMLATALGLGLRGPSTESPRIAPVIDVFAEGERSHIRANMRVHIEYELPPLRAVLETGAAAALALPERFVDQHPFLAGLFVDLAVRGWSDDTIVLCDELSAGKALWPSADGYLAAADASAGPTDRTASARRMLLLRSQLHSSPPAGRDDADHLAAQAAREAVVLLRNDGLLPLVTGEGMKVAVIGAQAAGLRRIIEKHLHGSAATVSYHSGADRYAVWLAGTPHRLTVTAAGDVVCKGRHGIQFELHQWRPEVYALLSPDGTYVSVGDDGTVGTDQPSAGHCPAAAGFRLLATDGDVFAMHHVASDRYLAVEGDTVTTVEEWEHAALFRFERTEDGSEAAAAIARDADVAIVVAGNSPLVERHAGPRVKLDLPTQQQQALRAVRAANSNTVLVVASDYPYTIDWADENVPAILWTAHNGPHTLPAIAEVLLGDHAPAGRLPQTWYRSADDIPAGGTRDIIGARLTYLYHDRKPLYPFGHGLTYTPFTYPRATVNPAAIAEDETTTVTVEVHNDGFVDSDEVVQLYSRQLTSRVRQPRLQLRDYRRVHVRAGATETITFRIRASDLSIWDIRVGQQVVERSKHEILVGGSSATTTAVGRLDVHGTPVTDRAVAGADVPATEFDESWGVSLVAGPSSNGTALVSVEPGAWTAYRRCDLTGVSAWSMTCSSSEHAAVELRLDSPTGALLGTIVVGTTGAIHRAGANRIPPNLGVHDVFVVFSRPDVTAAELVFHR